MSENGVTVLSPFVALATFGTTTITNSVEQLKISYSIGSPGSCSIRIQPVGTSFNSKVIDTPTAVDIMTTIVRQNADYLQTRGVGQDIQLDINTGQGSLKFSGYISDSSPSYGLRDNGINLSAVGPEAILSTVSPQIYKTLYARKAPLEVEEGLPLGGIFAKAITELKSTLVTAGEGENLYPDDEKDIINNINTTNQPGLAFLTQVFNNTTAETWSTLLSNSDNLVTAEDLVLFCMSVMSNTSGEGMLNTLSIIAGAFGLVYIPDVTGGGAGALHDIVELLQQEPVDLELQMDQVQFFTSTGGILHPRRVVVLGSNDFFRRTGEDPTLGKSLYSLPIVESYPTDATDGLSLPVPPPVWWKAYYTDFSTPPSGGTYTVENLQKEVDTAVKTSTEKRDAASSMLRYWAQINYVNKIGNITTGVISGLPLSGDIVPGTMVRLVDSNTTVPLGVGLVNNIQHNMSVDGKNLDTSSNMSLSYVTFPE